MLPRPPHNRLVSLLLVGALLLCHGAFGALHLAPDPPPPSAAGGHAAAEGHVGVGHGEHPKGHPAQHGPDAGYFAVLLGVLLGGLALSLLPSGRRGVRTLPALRRSAEHVSARVPGFARGPTLPSLQVFRL